MAKGAGPSSGDDRVNAKGPMECMRPGCLRGSQVNLEALHEGHPKVLEVDYGGDPK